MPIGKLQSDGQILLKKPAFPSERGTWSHRIHRSRNNRTAPGCKLVVQKIAFRMASTRVFRTALPRSLNFPRNLLIWVFSCCVLQYNYYIFLFSYSSQKRWRAEILFSDCHHNCIFMCLGLLCGLRYKRKAVK